MSDGEKITLPAGQSSATYAFSAGSAAELEEQLRDFYARVDYVTLDVSSPSLDLNLRIVKAMNANPLRVGMGPWEASIQVERLGGRWG